MMWLIFDKKNFALLVFTLTLEHIFVCLLQHGADPKQKNSFGLTPLEVVLRGPHSNRTVLVGLLKSKSLLHFRFRLCLMHYSLVSSQWSFGGWWRWWRHIVAVEPWEI